ncbi:hypothetical protein NI389_12255 [Pseudoalteromonas xiamenensis]|uniref:hypothetical protein n=1 Tax=Pseudoalteromonas xiamenensis TaxID=882626 RepID=UPI0027E5275C|nr:hypothetical protein [Pseudoalteromonas xiamenensis]WMN58987.1 hypothetical protein NI389_12255 [Pseudoalteromonas xiamenensis]
MKLGTKFGILFSCLGCSIGAYFGLSPVFTQLQSGALTGQEAGLMFSAAGVLIGCLLATASIMSSKKHIT